LGGGSKVKTKSTPLEDIEEGGSIPEKVSATFSFLNNDVVKGRVDELDISSPKRGGDAASNGENGIVLL